MNKTYKIEGMHCSACAASVEKILKRQPAVEDASVNLVMEEAVVSFTDGFDEKKAMQAVEKGGNRQELHERLRQHAIAAGKQVKEEGLPNDMVDRIAADPAFGLTKEEIVAGLVPENFVGRAPQQVEEFIAHILKPIFDANPDAVEQHANLSV